MCGRVGFTLSPHTAGDYKTFFGKSQIFFCLKLRQIGISERNKGGAGHTVYSDQINRCLEEQVLNMQAAMAVQFVSDNIFDGVQRLVLCSKHIACDRDLNRFATLQAVAGEILTLLRAAAGIDIEFSYDAVHGILQGVGSGCFDRAGCFCIFRSIFCECGDHAHGKLMIGTIEATAFTELPSLLLGYRRENPDVQLSLKVDLNDVFLKPLMERSLDGAFIAGPVIHPELTSIRLKQERLVLVGSRNEAILSADQILTEAPLVTFPEGSVFRRRFELLLASGNLSFQDRMTYVNSLGAMIATISAGVGYGYLPLSIVEPYVREGLVSIYPFEDPYSEYDVVFAYRRDHIMDAAFRNFIACVRRKEEELSGTERDG